MPSETSRPSHRARGRPAAVAPTDRDQEIIDLYEAGVPQNQIKDTYGVSRQRIWQIVQRWGARPRRVYTCSRCERSFPLGTAKYHWKTHRPRLGRSGITPEIEGRDEYVAEAYLRGDRLDDISRTVRTFGSGVPLTYTTIYRILRRMGIEPNRGGGHYERTPEARARIARGIKPEKRGWRAPE